MESRFQRLVLTLGLALTCSSLFAADAGQEADILDDIVSPDLERRVIQEAKIDAETLELGFYAGVMAFEDFGTNDVFGARAALHISEDVFFEFNIGASTLDESSIEHLGGTRLLTETERDLVYYNLVLGFNLLPGEIHLSRWSFHSNLYLLAGAGNTLFADNEHLTYLFGGGFRMAATDWLSLRLEVRNHVLTHAIFGEDKQIQNMEAQLGLTLFF